MHAFVWVKYVLLDFPEKLLLFYCETEVCTHMSSVSYLLLAIVLVIQTSQEFNTTTKTRVRRGKSSLCCLPVLKISFLANRRKSVEERGNHND